MDPVSISTIVSAILNFFSRPLVCIINRYQRTWPTPPKRTLSVAHTNKEVACLWGMGNRLNVDCMQIAGDFLVTNISHVPVKLSGALINKKQKVKGTILITKPDLKFSSAEYFISPGETVDARIVIYLNPVVRNKGELFSDDIAVVDNFGNEHWIENCKFEFLGSN